MTQTLLPTAAPSDAERDALEQFEAELAILGEADARLRNLASLFDAS